RVLRDQLLGCVGNLDEEAVPVLYDIDRRYEGFARVLDAGVTIDRDHLFAGHIPFFVRLERVAGGGGVLVESRFSGPVRPNNHSITSSDVHGYHGVPFPILSYSHPATTSAAVVNL